VAYGGGRFVALGVVQNGGWYERLSVYGSPDGIRWRRFWTRQDLPAGGRDIAYCGGRFVISGVSGGRTLVSTDGRQWGFQSFVTEGGSRLILSSVAFGNGVFVARAGWRRSRASPKASSPFPRTS